MRIIDHKESALILNPIKKSSWVMGSGKATNKLGADAADINPTGDWSAYDSTKELQERGGFETYNCTNFGTLLALIALATFKKLQFFPKNCSERYTGVVTGTQPGGNDPWHVIQEIATQFGVISEDVLPWTDSIRTWDQYYSPNPMDEMFVALGQKVLEKYDIEPQWVFTREQNLTPQQKKAKLQAALRRGTVCVSVLAWEQEGNVYVKDQGAQDAHWVWLQKYDNNGYPIIRDQYEPFIKKLSKDYDFNVGVMYFMRDNPDGIPPFKRNYYLQLLLKLWKQLLAIQQNIKKKVDNTPPMESNKDKLYRVALASLGTDMSPQDLAPDSLACMESLDGVWFKAFGEHLLPLPGRLSTKAGYEALLKDSRFKVVSVPTTGCIVMSPTGYSTKRAPHGHVGIWGNYDVMSNDSDTGKWMDNYTHKAWYDVFQGTLGFPVVFFEPQ